MISKEILKEYINRSKKKNFLNLFEKILALNNKNLFDFYSKQLLYITIILE